MAAVTVLSAVWNQIEKKKKGMKKKKEKGWLLAFSNKTLQDKQKVSIYWRHKQNHFLKSEIQKMSAW